MVTVKVITPYIRIIRTKNALRHQSVTIIFKTDNDRFMNRHQIIHAHTIKTNLNSYFVSKQPPVINDHDQD